MTQAFSRDQIRKRCVYLLSNFVSLSLFLSSFDCDPPAARDYPQPVPLHLFDLWCGRRTAALDPVEELKQPVHSALCNLSSSLIAVEELNRSVHSALCALSSSLIARCVRG
jgi:hypothetical protein